MSYSHQEALYEGWLTKSPPSKRIWKARWRKRWFALRQSGELPDQYFLEYYTNRNCRKLKGTIDLDQCQQVDTGLQFNELKYQYVFDIKTPRRTYYLAAETEQERNTWVEYICRICDLKDNDGEATYPELKSLSTGVSGPYIPISQCITGKPLTAAPPIGIPPRDLQPEEEEHMERMEKSNYLARYSNNDWQSSQFYDSPRNHQFPNVSPESMQLQSPCTDTESLFSEEDCTRDTLNNEHDLNMWHMSDMSRRFTRLSTDITPITPQNAPPRPPKPTHLIIDNNLNLYSNLGVPYCETPAIDANNGNVTVENHLTDQMYDFPRSHHDPGEVSDTSNEIPPSPGFVNERTLFKTGSRMGTLNRHCYNNAAPVTISEGAVAEGQTTLRRFVYDVSPGAVSMKNDVSSLSSCNSSAYPNSEITSLNNSFRFDQISPGAVSKTESTASTTQIFRYDPKSIEDAARIIMQQDEPPSPKSPKSPTSASSAMYSNLPSPLLDGTQTATPPPINRELKPRGGVRDSVISLNDPPSVNRRLKPMLHIKAATASNECQEYGNIRRQHEISPTSVISLSPKDIPDLNIHHQSPLDSPTGSNFEKLQYLDLDLDVDTVSLSSMHSNRDSKQQMASSVYKQVDFLKTEAFNRTKQRLEEERTVKESGSGEAG